MNSNQNQSCRNLSFCHVPENGSNSIRSKETEREEDVCALTDHCEGNCENDVQHGIIDRVWNVGCYKINPTTQSGIHGYVIIVNFPVIRDIFYHSK